MGIVVAVKCNAATSESHRTADICYSILSNTPGDIFDDDVREELLLLAQQATHRSPSFSAAGFFTIDYSLLLGLFATVTSYAILIVQVNK